MKNDIKREKIAEDNNTRANNEEPVLFTLFSNFLAKTKKSAPKKDEKAEKLSQMPVQMKEDESEGEVYLLICRCKKR